MSTSAGSAPSERRTGRTAAPFRPAGCEQKTSRVNSCRRYGRRTQAAHSRRGEAVTRRVRQGRRVEFAYQESARPRVIERVFGFSAVFGLAGNCGHRRRRNELQPREFTAPIFPEPRVEVGLRFAATQQHVARKEPVNDLLGVRCRCRRFVDRGSLPQIDKAKAATQSRLRAVPDSRSAISVRRESVVIDCRAARRRQANFEPLKQSRFAARIARSLRRGAPAGSQFRAQAGAREVAGQL